MGYGLSCQCEDMVASCEIPGNEIYLWRAEYDHRRTDRALDGSVLRATAEKAQGRHVLMPGGQGMVRVAKAWSGQIDSAKASRVQQALALGGRGVPINSKSRVASIERVWAPGRDFLMTRSGWSRWSRVILVLKNRHQPYLNTLNTFGRITPDHLDHPDLVSHCYMCHI